MRRASGGNDWTAQFVRGLLWKYRFLLIIVVVSSLAAALFEGSTMAMLTVALQTVETGSFAQTKALPSFLSDLAMSLQTAGGASSVFLALVLMAVILQLLRSSFDYVGRSVSATLQAWVEGDLRRRIFTQLASLSYPEISRHKIGSLTSFNEQVNNVGNLIRNGNQALSDLTVIAAYVVVLLWISWQMTLVAVVVLGLVTIRLRNVRASIRAVSRRFMGASVAINERFVEYLQNIRLLHVFSREPYAIAEVEAVIDDSVRARRQGLQRAALIPLLMQSTTIIGAACFLVAGYLLIEHYGRGSYAGLITFVFVLYRLMPRMASMNRSVGVLSTEWPFAARVADILRTDDKSFEHSGRAVFDGLFRCITFDEVSLRYAETDRNSLDDVSFTIPAGKMIAFVGPSGAGKTSVINLLLRLYDPSTGQIRVDGTNIRDFSLAAWRDRIGVVDQETFLFNASVMDNIRFGRLDATEDEVVEAARIANAHDFILSLPQGYETTIGDRGHRMSGGQRQRLAIARAVVRDPAILVFDEATSALDSHSERLIQESLEELRQERTLVVIAHRLSTVAEADTIIVLDEGHIVESGTHEELVEAGGEYARLWSLQAAERRHKDRT